MATVIPFPGDSLQKIARTRLSEMKEERLSYEAHWKDLISYFLTRRGRWLTDSTSQRGNKRNQKLIDPTPKFAARTLGAGMHAGSTNPSTAWFKLSTPDPEMMDSPAVSEWLYAVENRMRDVFARSNLYSVLPSIYQEAGVFGTAPMIMLEHPTKVVHFVPKTVGSYYLAANSDGVIDTLYCEYKMTTRQMVDDFGIENVSEQIQNEYNVGNKRNALHDVLHCIEPNQTRVPGARDNKNMLFSSTYFEQGAREDMPPLRKSGFEDNPIACFRWETTEITDPYGSSCGMDALGCAQAMQIQQKNKAKAVDKLVDPPMVADPAIENKPSTLLPGGVTYAGFTPNGSAPRFQPAYVIRPDLQGLLLDITDIRQLVEQAMYTDLFFAITRADPRNASVPEIDARKEEQILALGPVLENQKGGLIEMVIDRTFNIMMRKGLLPQTPPELSGVNLKVELVGALQQAFRAIAGNKIQQFAGFVGSVAMAQANAGQPVTAFDKWDSDQTIDEVAQAMGVPPTIVRGDDVVAQIRAARQQQQQAAQMASMAQPMKDASVAAKNLSQTDVGGGQNALQQVANG